MPGENCCIPLCGNNRRMKGVGFFKLPSKNKQYRQEWRKRWVNEILKYRELDAQLRERIDKELLFTCEEHFHPHEIDHCKLFS